MSFIDALTISFYRQRTVNVVGRVRLTAVVRRIDVHCLRRTADVSVLYALMTVEACPYGIVKAMSFRMSFRADDMLCVNAGASLKGHAWKRRSTESQSQETHGCFQKAVGLLRF